MPIKFITIRDIVDFKTIIDSPIILTGDKALQEKETLNNMWVLSIDPYATKAISLNDLVVFVSSLLKERTQQITKSAVIYPAIFYMWFDEMAAQLRFNIISDFNQKLPFGCHLEIINFPQPILEEFLRSHYHDGIPWSELEQSKNDFNDNDNDDKPFILKVFTVHINS